MVSYVKYKKGRAIQLNLKIKINLQLKMIKKMPKERQTSIDDLRLI